MQIRDSHGQILVADLHLFSKPVQKAADKSAGKKAGKNGKKPYAPLSQYDDTFPGGSLSFVMTAGDDGCVYAYSIRKPDVIERIHSSGEHEAIKVAKLPLPPNRVVRPIDMYEANGEILIHFAAFSTKKPGPKQGLYAKKQYWSAYETYPGEFLQTYTSNSKDWGERSLLAGYSPGSFYFLKAYQEPSGNVAYTLLHATPE